MKRGKNNDLMKWGGEKQKRKSELKKKLLFGYHAVSTSKIGKPTVSGPQVPETSQAIPTKLGIMLNRSKNKWGRSRSE